MLPESLLGKLVPLFFRNYILDKSKALSKRKGVVAFLLEDDDDLLRLRSSSSTYSFYSFVYIQSLTKELDI